MVSITLPTTAVVASEAESVELIAAEVIAQGQVVYLNPSTRQVSLAQADASGTKSVKGVARQSVGAAGAPVDIAFGGRVTGLSGLTPGTYYVLSASTAGAIAPSADLVSTNYNVLVGVADSATSLILLIKDWELVMP